LNFDALSVDSDAELVGVERVEALAIEASADVPFDNADLLEPPEDDQREARLGVRRRGAVRMTGASDEILEHHAARQPLQRRGGARGPLPVRQGSRGRCAECGEAVFAVRVGEATTSSTSSS
jgi:hypothetical protein